MSCAKGIIEGGRFLGKPQLAKSMTGHEVASMRPQT